MANKITKAQMFGMIKVALQGGEVEVSTEDMLSALDHELELLANKRSSKKPTKAQRENMELLPIVLEALKSIGAPATVADVIATGMVGNISSQKCSALLKMLKNDGSVARTEEKGVAYFSPVVED